MTPIQEIDRLDAAVFHAEILPSATPIVVRGLVRDWPVVVAGKESVQSFCDYVRRFDRGYPVDTVHAPASARGRIFYNGDLSGLNCRMEQASLSSSLDFMLEHLADESGPTLAVQSAVISRYLPGMERDNRLPEGLVPDGIDPRLWLGSRTTVAAHYDPSENLACCIAGARRFTLFPPDQVGNLYVGPFEMTPAGATISMVDLDAPDYEAYPKFQAAEEAALVADLEPGDAIYIPYLWWHHVRSLDNLNGLVNYWWATPDEARGDPRNAMLHAMLAIRSLPAPHRDAWRAMFDHYVFERDGGVADHLPENRRGVLGDMQPDALRRLRQALSRALSRN